MHDPTRRAAMTSTATVQAQASTIGEVRAWLAEIDRAGLPDDTPVHVKTRVAMSPLGPTLRSIAAQGTAGGGA
jgi:hypothetical protein